MRKLVFALSLFVVFSTQAQKKMNLTAEQAATLHTKQMTLRLELNEQQQKQVYVLAEQNAKKRKTRHENKTSKKEMSAEQRYEAKLAHLDYQIEMQNKMKSILNEQQYEQWKKMMYKREKEMHQKKKKHHKKMAK